jgi:hypothetical protein
LPWCAPLFLLLLCDREQKKKKKKKKRSTFSFYSTLSRRFATGHGIAPS